MRQVAEAGGAELLRPADRAALEAAYRHVFKGPAPLDVESLPAQPARRAARPPPRPEPRRSRRSLPRRHDPGRRTHRRGQDLSGPAICRGLDVRADYLRQLAETARGRLDWVKMDMMRQNIRSIDGLTWNPDDVISAFLPYSGTGADLEFSRQRRGQERDGRFRPARLLAGLGARLRDHRGHLRAAMEFLGSGAQAGGHITPALRESRLSTPPWAPPWPSWSHDEADLASRRCQVSASRRRYLDTSPALGPPLPPFRRGEAGLSVRDRLPSPLERLSRHGTARASHTGPQLSFS